MSTSIPSFQINNISKTLLESKIVIVVAQWNQDITYALRDGAFNLLTDLGIKNIKVEYVPGAFELPVATRWMFEQLNADAVIAIGCLIKGDTDHYQFIADSVSKSLASVGVNVSRPVIFSVLTVNTIEQAEERAGLKGSQRNVGKEAAEAVLQMLILKEDLTKDKFEETKIGFR